MVMREYPEVKAILLDIEGTTTPIEFVHKDLFSYARDHVADFLKKNSGEGEIASLMKDLKEQQGMDSRNGLEPPEWPDSEGQNSQHAAKYCRWLIDRDSKFGALKALQGHIWEDGFNSGELHGVVYDDVPSALKRWRQQGKKVCIYSSGSVMAQKMIYSTTDYGDLTELINCFFDTSVGHKREASSYYNIARGMGIKAEEILFLSDVTEELDAAREAGMQAILVTRGDHSGNSGHTQVKNFESLYP